MECPEPGPKFDDIGMVKQLVLGASGSLTSAIRDVPLSAVALNVRNTSSAACIVNAS